MNGKVILDLFAGTGNLGLEALSRTAQYATFIDCSKIAVELVAKNATLLNFQDRVTIIQDDVFKAIAAFARNQSKFDVIFADPPYNHYLSSKILSAIASHDILNSGGAIILEHDRNDVPIDIQGFSLLKRKIAGETGISLYENRTI